MIYLDLVNFKKINDKHGHNEGDRLLSAFADIIKGTLRQSDLVARIGGDEFVVVLIGTTKKAAEGIINKPQHALDEYNQKETFGYTVSFSHGIAQFKKGSHSTIEALLKESDAAMYKNKYNKNIA